MAFFWNPAEKAHLIRRLEEKAKELKAVSDFFSKLDPCEPTVTVFGSARIGPDHPAYVAAEALGKELVRRIGAAVVTGGGQGIMEAANKGAYQEGGRSIGMCIQLPNGEQPNPYLTEKIDFKHLGPRKEALIAMSAFVIFVGGIGTLDELTDLLCRLKLGQMSPRVPVIIWGQAYWDGLLEWVHSKCVPEGTINPDELKLIVEDNVTHIVDRIQFYLRNLD